MPSNRLVYMITYQNRQGWRRLRLGALAVGAVMGAVAWWWSNPRDDGAHLSAKQGSSALAVPGVKADAKQVESALVAPPPTLDDERPVDFSPEDWAALKNAVAKNPNPKKEMERIVKYLRFQRGFEQWQSLKNSPDVAQRQALAKHLLEQVPERLHNGETTMGEALMLTAAFWSDLEPNEQVRKQRIEDAKAILAQAAPEPDPQQAAEDASKLAEYKRREAAIVADWQAQPIAQRDQAKLETALESARRAVYASAHP